jgi:hypothetical protein
VLPEGELPKSFVSDAQARNICQLAVSTALMIDTASHQVAATTTTDNEALVLGMLGHISRQLQRLVEVTAGFDKPIDVVLRHSDPPDETVN